MTTRTCVVSSCIRPGRARGLCASHYTDWWNKAARGSWGGWTVGTDKDRLAQSVEDYVKHAPKIAVARKTRRRLEAV